MKDLGWAKEDHLDIPISPMKKSEDDRRSRYLPAGRCQASTSTVSVRTGEDAQRSQWQTVRTYVQTAGLFSGVSRDTKTFGDQVGRENVFRNSRRGES